MWAYVINKNQEKVCLQISQERKSSDFVNDVPLPICSLTFFSFHRSLYFFYLLFTFRLLLNTER